MRRGRSRRFAFSAVALAVALSVAGCGGSSDGAAGDDASDAADGDTAAESGFPERVPGLEGGEVALMVPGRPSVVAFVAAWCAPCYAELPALQQLHERLGDRVTIVAVAVEEEPSATRRLIEETGVRFPVGLDEDGNLLMTAGIAALPGTILLDADGEFAERLSGAQSVEEFEAELQPLLG